MNHPGKAGIALAVLLTLFLGISINRVAWQHRKLIWQLQGALIGGATCYAIGRLQTNSVK